MQVAAQLTPSDAPHVAAAIVAAYGDLRGRPPPAKSSWLWPLALSANETASWRKMWNWNVGNVTTPGASGIPWYANPDVTAPLKFRAFDDPRSGALAMLQALDRWGGVAAADAGDAAGWQRALNLYLCGPNIPPCNVSPPPCCGPYPPPWGRIASLDGVQPAGGYEVVTPPAPLPARQAGSQIAVATAAAVGMALAAGYAAYQGRIASDHPIG